MGYTHYFSQRKSFTRDQWDQVKKGVHSIVDFCQKNGIVLQYDMDEEREPSITDDQIRFNGQGKDGYETFMIFKSKNRNNQWETGADPVFRCCKTERKSYDTAVGLCLLWIDEVAPKVLNVSSDGHWSDIDEWVPIRRCFNKLFGYEAKMPLGMVKRIMTNYVDAKDLFYNCGGVFSYLLSTVVPQGYVFDTFMLPLEKFVKLVPTTLGSDELDKQLSHVKERLKQVKGTEFIKVSRHL